MPRKKGKGLQQKNENVATEEDGSKGRRCEKICGFLGVLKSLLRHCVMTGATSVSIRIDLEYPYLQIADNGGGISASEIGKIGKTTFLDLITVAEEVLIETMTMSMEKSTVMKFRNKVLLVPESTTRASELEVPPDGETFDWFQSSPKAGCSKAISCTGERSCHQRNSTGTTFTLTNIQLSIMEKTEQLDKKIVNHVKTFAIFHHQMSITLKDIKGNKLVFATKRTKSIADKVTSIYNLNMEFHSIVMSSENIIIEAWFGVKFYNSPEVQFVFINGELCSNARLLKTIKGEWKCGGGAGQYPVYVLRITIKIISGKSVETLDQDKVIKECIKKCVSDFKLKNKSVEDASDDSEEDCSPNKSVYVRPNIVNELKKKSKERKLIERSSKEKRSVEILPSPIYGSSPVLFKKPEKRISERRKPNSVSIIQPISPVLLAKNVTLSEIHPAKTYFRTCTSTQILTPSFVQSKSDTRNQPPPNRESTQVMNDLQNKVRHLQREISLLRSAKSHVSQTRQRQERDYWGTISQEIRSAKITNEKTIATPEIGTENNTQKRKTPPKQCTLSDEPQVKKLPLNGMWHQDHQLPRGRDGGIHIYNYAQLSVFNGPQMPGLSNQLL